MLRKALAILVALFLVLAGAGAFLYATNATPVVPPISAGDAAASAKPYVVKLHARWCPICMVTQNVWPQVRQAYSGKANLVVFDFTNEKTTAASREDAKRAGLESVFEDYLGVTGPIVVLDARTRAVRAEIGGTRSFAPYRAAIDAALAAAAN
jgi:hypothetical protein